MFDIEEKMYLIPEVKTRELFKEVLSSYQHENYRSAIVMLWSVVVADIIFKLQFLSNAYGNAKADSILKYIKKQQEEKPTSSEWENEILNKACNELKFISLTEKESLEFLHKQRHLSAHPLITDNDLLFKPTKESARFLIRTALESILLKTALLHSELVNFFTDDLKSRKEQLTSYESIKLYIEKRFFTNISNDGSIRILKALWHFVFCPTNEDEILYKQINWWALLVCFEKFNDIYIEEISKNSSYFQVSSDEILNFIQFLIKNKKVYNVIGEPIKIIIGEYLKQPINFSTLLFCDFIANDLEEHLENIISKMKNNIHLNLGYSCNMQAMYKKSKEYSVENLFFKICILNYTNSCSFNDADSRYYYNIKPYLELFNLDLFMYLFEQSNKNDQTYNRMQSNINYIEILKYFYEKGGKEDEFLKFNNLKRFNDSYKLKIKSENNGEL